MFESLFGGDDTDEDEQADEGVDGGQAPAEPAAGQPGQPADPMAADGEGEGPPVDEGPDVGELDVRMGELQDDVDSVESSLRTLESSQAEFADTIEEMDERVRQLVGIYDRVSAAENPFVDDDDAGEGHTDGTEGQENGESPGHGAAEPAAAEEGSDGHGEESVVSFDDLEQQGNGADGAGHSTNGAAEDGSPGAGENGRADGGHGQSGGRGSGGAQEPEPEHTSPAEPGQAAGDTPERGPVLESVPDSFAGEVLVMEWLSVLMEGSGPADALRAVGHYEDAGWISREVRDHLVDVIGGPTLDVHVDPTQSSESTAEEHAVSHRYLSVLAHLDDV